VNVRKGQRRVAGRIAAALALAIPLVLGPGRGWALAQAATLLPAFKGGVRRDAILKDPQGIISISSACYAANGGTSPGSAQRCIADKLKVMGASAQAIAFADYAPVPSAIEYYKQYRNAAAVYAVMRWADGASGWCLIGRSGQAIGMWEPTSAEHGPKFIAFARVHPNAILWMPTDRGDVPEVIALPKGVERLIMPFKVKECNACAIIGNAQVGFDFDHAGNYRGSDLVGIIAAPSNSQ
jgi:hypothetical protein